MEFYKVNTITELSIKLDVGQPTISKWRKNNSIDLLKKKCKELEIYNDIFEELENNIGLQYFIQAFKIINVTSNDDDDLLKYFLALQSVAIATNNKDKLTSDIKELLQKYLNK